MIFRETCLRLRDLLDADQKGKTDNQKTFQKFLKNSGVPKFEFYATDMGKMLLAANVEAELDPDETASINAWEFDDVCQLGKDKRCQAGHIVRSLLRRMRRLGRARQFDERSTVQYEFLAFLNNARSTVLIFDRGDLDLEGSTHDNRIKIDSVRCREWLDLSRYGYSDTIDLCSQAFYAREQIPYTDIFGSGYMVNNDTVVTAAHVLEQAFIHKIKPENLIFLRRHLVYDTKQPEIWAFKNQFYKLAQDDLLISEQMKNGSKDGDMAWVKIQPLSETRKFNLKWNGMIDKPLVKDQRVYALGHGLGVPMKISFDGKIQDGIYHNTPSMFTCDMHLLPGNSGCPIFDFETHKLVGVISGMHKLRTVLVKEGNCVKFEIDMTGKASGVATHIQPFIFLDAGYNQR